MMKSKFLLMCLAVLLVCSCVAGVTFAADTETASKFDLDFEDYEAGAEFITSSIWCSDISNASPTIVEENGNKYVRIDGVTTPLEKNVGFYPVNWTDTLSDDKYSEFNFRFKMSDMSKSDDTDQRPYFYVSLNYKDSSNSNQFPKIFGISDDGKSIIAYDGSNRIYENGVQVKYYNSLYTSETSLADQWLSVNLTQNYSLGLIKCTIKDEKGNVLTSFVQKLGDEMKTRYLHNIFFGTSMYVANSTSYRRMKLDIDDISYKPYTSVPNYAIHSVDFEQDAIGELDTTYLSGATKYWLGNTKATRTVKSENGKHYLNMDFTDTSVTTVSGLYLINWAGGSDFSKDQYSESAFRFRLSDLNEVTDTTGYPYMQISVGYTNNKSATIFAFADDGKSIIAYDQSKRIYKDGVQLNYKDVLYQADTTFADQWLTLSIVNDFVADELTCRIYGQDGKLLTRFVAKLSSLMADQTFHNIRFAALTHCNRYMNFDIDEISYEAFSSVPVVPSYDVTVDYNTEQGSVSANGLTNGKVTLEKGETLTLTIDPNEGYIVDKITVNGLDYASSNNQVVFDNITEAKTVSVKFKEQVITPTIDGFADNYIFPGTYLSGGKEYPCVTSYYQITVPASASIEKFGAYFGDGTNSVKLEAQEKNEDNQFGVRVFGVVETGQFYTFKGFVKLADIDEICSEEASCKIEQ